MTGGAIMNSKVINGFESPDELRDLMGEPMDLAARKSVSKLDKYSKEYISRSPFVCIGSVSYTHLTLPTSDLV